MGICSTWFQTMLSNDIKHGNWPSLGLAKALSFLNDQPSRLNMGRSARGSGLVIDTDIFTMKSGTTNHIYFLGFDLTFAEVVHPFDHLPGLLIPHSHIFGGVNSCQTGLALKYASEWCSELHILYIVAMNTDDLQKIAYEEIGGEEIFDPSPFIIFSKQTDQEEGGFVTSRF